MTTALIERYRDRLPLEKGDPVVSLNEGSTPLIEAPRPLARETASVIPLSLKLPVGFAPSNLR